ncbi:MAG: HlyD family efflux transporter periplasmic adaptor subunit, partial [Pseudomonadota bacterium]
RRLTPLSAVLELERAELDLTGALGARAAQRLEAEGRLAELSARREALEIARREEALSGLREAALREAELLATRARLADQLEATQIRAPLSGIVHDIKIFAKQSVIQAGEELLFIVPQDSALIVSAQVSPLHVDSVRIGQVVGLRFPSIETGPVPDQSGVVIALSPDILRDEATGAAYYLAQIALPGRDRLPRAADLPGMPVEAFFKTEARTPLAYLTAPLTTYFWRAFREG